SSASANGNNPRRCRHVRPDSERARNRSIPEQAGADSARGFQVVAAHPSPRTRVINILIGRNDVVVARKHYWMTAVVKAGGVVDQPFEPGQFVVEFGTGLRVAVR